MNLLNSSIHTAILSLSINAKTLHQVLSIRNYKYWRIGNSSYKLVNNLPFHFYTTSSWKCSSDFCSFDEIFSFNKYTTMRHLFLLLSNTCYELQSFGTIPNRSRIVFKIWILCNDSWRSNGINHVVSSWKMTKLNCSICQLNRDNFRFRHILVKNDCKKLSATRQDC